MPEKTALHSPYLAELEVLHNVTKKAGYDTAVAFEFINALIHSSESNLTIFEKFLRIYEVNQSPDSGKKWLQAAPRLINTADRFMGKLAKEIKTPEQKAAFFMDFVESFFFRQATNELGTFFYLHPQRAIDIHTSKSKGIPVEYLIAPAPVAGILIPENISAKLAFNGILYNPVTRTRENIKRLPYCVYLISDKGRIYMSIASMPDRANPDYRNGVIYNNDFVYTKVFFDHVGIILWTDHDHTLEAAMNYSFDELLTRTKNEVLAQNSKEEFQRIVEIEQFWQQNPSVRKIFEFAAKSLLYINLNNHRFEENLEYRALKAKIKGKQNDAKKQQLATHLPRVNNIITISGDKNYEKTASQHNPSGEPYITPHFRRGHLAVIHYGPKRGQQKVVWRKETIVNERLLAHDATVKPKTYVVK